MGAVRAVHSAALMGVLNESVVFSTLLPCSHGLPQPLRGSSVNTRKNALIYRRHGGVGWGDGVGRLNNVEERRA